KEAQLVHEAKQNFKNEVCTNYIFIKSTKGVHDVDTLDVFRKANEIRNRITDSYTFKNLMHDLPENDLTFKYSSGSDCFNALQKEYPFEVAAYRLLPDEISEPVKSKSGYFIIHLVDKKPIDLNSLSEDEIKSKILELKDERVDLIRSSFVERLKQEWNFTDN